MRSLEELTALTSLNLHDVGLQQLIADALAASLPTLRQLQSLDCSSNLLTAPIMDALAPAIQQCSALLSLNLWDTLSLAEPETCDLQTLADVVGAMPHLTALHIGVFWARYIQEDDGSGCPSEAAAEALIDSIHMLPQLVDLRLHLFNRDSPIDDGAAMLFGVADLTQLQRLHWALPQLSEDVLPAPLALKSLTSMHLDLLPGNDQYCISVTARHVAAMLKNMPSMPQLQRLWLRLPTISAHENAQEPCISLAAVLPQMACLSRLEYLAARLDARETMLVDPGVASIALVVEVAVSMPQLQVLHVPVSVDRRSHERMVAALTEAQARMELSIDMYVLEDEKGGPHLAVYVPMFPCVRALDIMCKFFDEPLEPLAAGMSSMGRLSELRMNARVLNLEENIAALLDSVASITSLERLEWSVDGPRYTLQELGDFVSDLRGLTNLTHVKFDIGAHPLQVQIQFLSTCTALPRLRALDLGAFDNWCEETCESLLTRLRLEELHVSQPQHEWFPERDGAGSELDVLEHLKHLRRLRYSFDCDTTEVPERVEALPAFQCLR